MAFGHFSDDEVYESADINVTPLVDVMLVLLIVFMITMPVLTHSIPLSLPTAANANAAQQSKPTSPLRLSIGADGQYKLGDRTFSLAQLQNELLLKAQADPDVVLAIAADKHVAYDYVAQVLAAARDAGLVKVGFVTQDK
ncbi:ExbD/TolR family protein [Snodgrassella communis]|uniref:ExbD/TolR family protein n=1 Tax=Snodgrassella communis TaxID=2946699 RepID=UPI001EF4BBDE|nr:biopolymer transporter ExbD [Snodgrassella communis]